MQNPLMLVYWDDPLLWTAAFNIVLTPLYWLLVSHIELRTQILSRLFCSRHVALFLFAVTVVLLSGHRDLNFLLALRQQPKWAFLQENVVLWFGHVLCLVGFCLVLRSGLALGFVATFMGDYFHLRLKRRVTSFPYSWMTHPMYSGAFMLFLGMALVHASQAGLVLALLAGLMYVIAASLEEPYTDQFYIPYPLGRRHVGVQVACATSLIEVKARTVGVQYKGEVEIVEQDDQLADFDVEVVETDEEVVETLEPDLDDEDGPDAVDDAGEVDEDILAADTASRNEAEESTGASLQETQQQQQQQQVQIQDEGSEQKQQEITQNELDTEATLSPGGPEQEASPEAGKMDQLGRGDFDQSAEDMNVTQEQEDEEGQQVVGATGGSPTGAEGGYRGGGRQRRKKKKKK